MFIVSRFHVLQLFRHDRISCGKRPKLDIRTGVHCGDHCARVRHAAIAGRS